MDGSRRPVSRNRLMGCRGVFPPAALMVVLIVSCLILSGPSIGRGRGGAGDIDPGKDGTGAALGKFAFQSLDERSSGQWSVVDDATAGAAIEHSAAERSGNRFPLAIYKPAVLKDFELNLRLKAVAGRAEQSGVALRLITPDDYYLVRVDAHRDTVAFSRVENGTSAEIADVEADVFEDRWQSLKVRAEGEQFTVWLDGTWLFTAYDRSFPGAGHVALWTSPESITRFDAFEVSPFPATEAR